MKESVPLSGQTYSQLTPTRKDILELSESSVSLTLYLKMWTDYVPKTSCIKYKTMDKVQIVNDSKYDTPSSEDYIKKSSQNFSPAYHYMKFNTFNVHPSSIPEKKKLSFLFLNKTPENGQTL